MFVSLFFFSLELVYMLWNTLLRDRFQLKSLRIWCYTGLSMLVHSCSEFIRSLVSALFTITNLLSVIANGKMFVDDASRFIWYDISGWLKIEINLRIKNIGYDYFAKWITSVLLNMSWVKYYLLLFWTFCWVKKGLLIQHAKKIHKLQENFQDPKKAIR